MHQSSFVGEPCTIGKGTKSWHFCYIMQDTVIGEYCNLGQNVVISPGCVIGYRSEDCPEASRAAAETLAVPIYPELSALQMRHVVQSLAAFYR